MAAPVCLTLAVEEPFALLLGDAARHRLEAAARPHALQTLVCHSVRELQRAGADLAVCRYADGAAPADAVQLAPDQVLPACAPSLVGSGQCSLESPSTLRWQTLLRLDPAVERRNQVDWARWLAANGLGTLEPRHWQLCPSTPAALRAAEEGAGVLLARLPLMRPALRTGRLMLPWPRSAFHAGAWYARPAPGRAALSALQDLVRALRSELRAA